MTLARAGRLMESIEPLQKAVELDSRSFDALSWLSIVLRRLGRADEATAAARAALELRPKDPDAYNNLGQALLAQANPKEAQSALETGIRLNPRSFSIQANLAFVYSQLDLAEPALDAFQRAIALAPNSLPIRVSFVKFLLLKAKAEAAVSLLAESIAMDPNSAELHLLMARALLLDHLVPGVEDRAATAEIHLRKSLAFDPNNGSTCGMLGFRLQAMGRFEEATPLLERAVRLEPTQGVAYCGLTTGKKFEASDDRLLDQMHGVLAGGSLQGKELSYLHYALAKAREDLGEYESAFGHYDEANRIAGHVRFSESRFQAEKFVQTSTLVQTLFDRQLVASAQTAPTSGPRPIFILGAMRSGTTLVEQILSSHPEIAGAGELAFWLQRSAELLRLGRESLGSNTFKDLGESYSQILSEVGGSASWVTDKMPNNYQFLGLIHLVLSDAPIIYMKRNALDTCLSIWTTPYEIPPDFAHDKQNIMLMYDQHLKLMDHWRAVLPPGRVLEVQYEELVEDREAVTRRMLKYCGIEWDDRCLHHELNPRAVYTPSQWQVRQPVNNSSVGRWKRFEPWLGDFRRMIPGQP
jgi:tetratricopeptide (TPR) repeat protein